MPLPLHEETNNKKVIKTIPNYNIVIIFVVSKDKSNMGDKPISKERQRLERELVMKTDIEKLKERFVNATTDSEIEAIDKDMKALADKDMNKFSKGMLDCITDTNKEADEVLLREKLESVLPFISVSALVKTYFKKSPQWFYQRLNGSIVNGKHVRFNERELNTLANALTDIGKKISQAAAFVF